MWYVASDNDLSCPTCKPWLTIVSTFQCCPEYSVHLHKTQGTDPSFASSGTAVQGCALGRKVNERATSLCAGASLKQVKANSTMSQLLLAGWWQKSNLQRDGQGEADEGDLWVDHWCLRLRFHCVLTCLLRCFRAKPPGHSECLPTPAPYLPAKVTVTGLYPMSTGASSPHLSHQTLPSTVTSPFPEASASTPPAEPHSSVDPVWHYVGAVYCQCLLCPYLCTSYQFLASPKCRVRQISAKGPRQGLSQCSTHQAQEPLLTWHNSKMSLWAFPSFPPSLLPFFLPLKEDLLYFPGWPWATVLEFSMETIGARDLLLTSSITGSEKRKGPTCLCLWWAVHLCLLQRGSKGKRHRSQSYKILQDCILTSLPRALCVSDWLQGKQGGGRERKKTALESRKSASKSA